MSSPGRPVFHTLGWLLAAVAVLLARIPAQPWQPGWVRWGLLCPALCLCYEAVARRGIGRSSRIVLALLLAGLIQTCALTLPLAGFSVSVSSILLVLMCVCFLVLSRQGHVVTTYRIPAFALVAGGIPVVAWLTAAAPVFLVYGRGWAPAAGLLVRGLEFGAAMIVLPALISTRPAMVAFLVMVTLKIALSTGA